MSFPVCCICKKNDKYKSYQNIGLLNWKAGYIKGNMIPLCRMCFTTRAGMCPKKYIKACKNILDRKPIPFKFPYKTKYSKTTCAYCKRKRAFSINRIDSSKGYVIGNLQPLCWLCNRMKGKHKEPTFFRHMERVASIGRYGRLCQPM
jgi:hypothetical protein